METIIAAKAQQKQKLPEEYEGLNDQSNTKGTFVLMTNGAHGPLWLSPGEYRFTLESAGAPVQIPKEFTRPDSTPLKVSWPTSEEKLKLETSISIRVRQCLRFCR